MRILIGVDGSRAAQTACDFVANRDWPAGTRVTIVGVIEPIVDWTGMAPASVVAAQVDDGLASLEAIAEERADELRRAGLGVETMVEVGHAGEVLVARAAELFADLVVVGSRGRGPMASAMLGSVSGHLVDHTGCPVLVARTGSATRMLLASDGTPSSRSIPRVLAAWGNAFRGLPVEVLSVAPRFAFVTPWAAEDPDADAELVEHEGMAEGVADEMMELGWHAAAISRAGDPGRLIVSEGSEWGADLIVTGSRGMGTLHRLATGSVAHDVLIQARSSVLVMRGQVTSPTSRRAVVAAIA